MGQGVLVLAIFLVLWEVGSAAGLLHRQLIPRPSHVLAAWVDWVVGIEGGRAGRFYSGT